MKGARMQQYAIGLEHDLFREYGWERFGIRVIANKVLKLSKPRLK